MRSKVSVRLKDPQNTAVSASDVDTVINDAIKEYKKKRFWFNEFKEDVILNVNDPILPPLPSGTPILDVFKKGGISINYSQTRWAVTKISSAEYDAGNTQGQGIPYVYTYRNNQYELYWYPDAAYTAVVRGLKDYVVLTANDTNDWLTYAEDLIMYESLSRLFGEFRQDDKMEGYYSARAKDQYNRLIAETNKRNKTGRIAVGEL